jgi:CelD/BcsL family acetyltransferase involved in cellulose biosynthesis
MERSRITLIDARSLDDDARDRWRALQRANAALASPYFSVEFTDAVAAVRDDVQIAIVGGGGGAGDEPAAFFPFQRGAANACVPVGGILSDHHGMIAGPTMRCDWPALLAATGLAFWRFDHLVAEQARDVDGASIVACTSPALDVSAGFDAWRARKQQAGSRQLADLDRKGRKLAREGGAVSFVADVVAERGVEEARAVLAQVFAQKSAQCLRTGAHDYFGKEPWTRALVERLLVTRTPTFAGALSALWAGDTLVAANMGMRSERVWHWWFPVYDHAYAAFSPGTLLLVRLAEAAAAHGMHILDLGKGNETYKERFADTSIAIAEGFVAQRTLQNVARGAAVRVERWLRSSPSTEWLRSSSMKPALKKLRATLRGGLQL